MTSLARLLPAVLGSLLVAAAPPSPDSPGRALRDDGTYQDGGY